MDPRVTLRPNVLLLKPLSSAPETFVITHVVEFLRSMFLHGWGRSQPYHSIPFSSAIWCLRLSPNEARCSWDPNAWNIDQPLSLIDYMIRPNPSHCCPNGGLHLYGSRTPPSSAAPRAKTVHVLQMEQWSLVVDNISDSRPQQSVDMM